MSTISADTMRRYHRERARNPLMAAGTALDIARSPYSQGDWEEDGHCEYTREVDGFTLTLKIENESIYPMPGDGFGEYVKEDTRGYGDWQGNYPEPCESFPLGLPYTVFRYSGPGWTQGEGTGYFLPEGVQAQFDYYRTRGQSKSVAWDLTRNWVESTLRTLFGGPLTYCTLVVTASRDDVELGSEVIGTTYVDDFADGSLYVFACVEEYGLIETAIKDARASLARLCECGHGHDGEDDNA